MLFVLVLSETFCSPSLPEVNVLPLHSWFSTVENKLKAIPGIVSCSHAAQQQKWVDFISAYPEQ